MENAFEKGPEQIPSKEAVMEVINRHAENTTLVREESDDEGLYLLEVTTEGEKSGETIQYEYMRKGVFDEGQSMESVIHLVHYKDGIPVGGHSIAAYSPETGAWE